MGGWTGALGEDRHAEHFDLPPATGVSGMENQMTRLAFSERRVRKEPKI